MAAPEKLSDTDLFKTYSHYQPDDPGEDSGERAPARYDITVR